ncbi:enoyl-CoA hydratase/isomerase family protein [Paracraurococcus lichenis]|uniref:Enoyl-CoA hydratase/isomerase family protein n=1 Tax=Paracraurococcus lichenis TaxID=3064888 RepID=A0ABT9E011_9PROT|nr:enoyl-CoA hydratase/isomerase family protein [Paracraurococcus sp. LOR1-02]MDO9709495.1 enoyl-CoA hydratase/isomerase family protein [Paracraurococcus sp. LOR1-02]
MLLIESRADIRVLRLSRPEKRNALSMALSSALIDAFQSAEAAAEVRAVVLCGEGAGFCAGGDLEERRLLADDAAAWQARAALADAVLAAPGATAKPVVAAVHGRVVGMGASLALGCDMVVAAEDALFSWPEARHGIWPHLVLPQLLRHLGPKDAFELLATGRALDAAEARALRLVNRVVAPDGLLEEACALASAAAQYPPEMLRGIKARIDAAGVRP